MKQAQATAEQLTDAEAKKNLVVGSQVTGLNVNSIAQAIKSGSSVDAIVSKATGDLVAEKMAQEMFDEMVPVVEEAGRIWAETGGNIDAVTDYLNAMGYALDSISYSLSDVLSAAVEEAQQALDVATDNLTRAFDAEKERIENAYQIQLTLLEAEFDIISDSVAELSRSVDMLASAKNRMVLDSPGFSEMSYSSARESLAEALESARAGDFSNLEDLEDPLNTLTKQGDDAYANSTDYERDFWKTYLSISELESLTGNQLSVEERNLALVQEQIDILKQNHQAQMESLDRQLESMLGLNENILTLSDAIQQFSAAQSRSASLQEKLEQETSSPTAPGQAPSYFDEAKYVINKTAQTNALLRSGDAETAAIIAGYGLDPSRTLSTSDIRNAFAQSGLTAQQHYLEYGIQEGVQPFATGGSFTVGGAGGVDSLSLPQMRVSPGEMVNISRPDVMSSMSEELRELRAEVRQLREENRAHAVAQIKSSQAIERNTDYLEAWDVNGLPAEETV
jgi:hypothetical protein